MRPAGSEYGFTASKVPIEGKTVVARSISLADPVKLCEHLGCALQSSRPRRSRQTCEYPVKRILFSLGYVLGIRWKVLSNRHTLSELECDYLPTNQSSYLSMSAFGRKISLVGKSLEPNSGQLRLSQKQQAGPDRFTPLVPTFSILELW